MRMTRSNPVQEKIVQSIKFSDKLGSHIFPPFSNMCERQDKAGKCTDSIGCNNSGYTALETAYGS